jgi:hypothetical protein
MPSAVIGVDPHKHSATIEVIDQRERVLAGGRFRTDHDGYKAMLTAGRKHGEFAVRRFRNPVLLTGTRGK